MKHGGFKQIRVFDNRESALANMAVSFGNSIIRYTVGDIRDISRVDLAMEGVDYLFHAAALKHVPLCEYNPFEAVKTNVYGTNNVMESASSHNVKKVVNISTDKAVNPINVLGATKLLAEKIVATAKYRKSDTIYANVRFGNVTWSEGSVFPVFSDRLKENEPIKVTSLEMERFYMTITDAVKLVFKAFQMMKGGETFILKMPTFKMGDLINAMAITHGEEIPYEVTGIRDGEKLKEELMFESEKSRAEEMEDFWVIREST